MSRFQNNVLPNGEANKTGPVYDLLHATRHASGHYKCTADNRVGQPDSRDILVNVLCKYSLFPLFNRYQCQSTGLPGIRARVFFQKGVIDCFAKKSSYVYISINSLKQNCCKITNFYFLRFFLKMYSISKTLLKFALGHAIVPRTGNGR